MLGCRGVTVNVLGYLFAHQKVTATETWKAIFMPLFVTGGFLR